MAHGSHSETARGRSSVRDRRALSALGAMCSFMAAMEGAAGAASRAGDAAAGSLTIHFRQDGDSASVYGKFATDVGAVGAQALCGGAALFAIAAPGLVPAHTQDESMRTSQLSCIGGGTR